mgnify:CR=1 FL=1
MKSQPRYFSALLSACFLLAWIASAGAQQKKVLDHSAYDIWNNINERMISNNGQWAMFSLSPRDKDAELRIKGLSSGQSFVVPRGESAAFSNASSFAVFMVRAFKDSVKQAKRDKVKDEKAPKDSLGIINLASGEKFMAARVKSFKMPKESGEWAAYLLEKEIKKKEEAKEKEKSEGEKKSEESGEKKPKDKKKKKPKKEGTTLVLRNLESGEEHRFESVVDYGFSENGERLFFTASSKDSTADGVYLVEPGSGAKTTVLAGAGEYLKAEFDKSGKQLAFVSNRDDFLADKPLFQLYHWRAGDTEAAVIAQAEASAFPPEWSVSQYGDVSFSENGKRIFFGSAPKPEPDPEEETPEDEKVKLDIWSWNDPLLQPMQLVRAKQERERSYRAVVYLDSKKIVQLADENMPEITLGNRGDADIAVGRSNMAYRKEISWESPRFNDVYVVDLKTGERKAVIEKLQSTATLSPNAGYISWWDRDVLEWFVYDVKSGKTVNASTRIEERLDNELHDWPYKPYSYGDAGWTNDDKLFLIYDKYDVWALDPTGKNAPRNLTEGEGRKTETRFRYVRLDRDENGIDASKPLLLSAFRLDTKAGGFYTDRIKGSSAPHELVMMDRRFSNPRKAKKADVLLYSRSSFVEFPDLWTSAVDFSGAKKISDANPQQSEYLWGSAELTSWHSADGIELQGILYKPEKFDPSKKYPMMVYFYEKMSNGLHSHRPPAPARSSISFSFYTSRGYVVFVPDIPYRVGYPGESCVNAVVPGVLSVLEKGFVDKKRIGVQGHSWGGYQIAYLITRSNLFAAAEAGAPVSNMVSAYGGIRWGSGMSRMFQYERTQSRIGGTLWEYPLRYIENSPIFWADKIETPLMYMHNDEDGAVPWYQGIELFVALRRLNQPVWMLNYNGEAHGLRQHKNQVDFAIRMQQFFDHYLKDAPAPVWMQEGVPAVKKGKTMGTELVTPDDHGRRN